MPSTLYLIDGHALAYRMYFALTAGGGSARWQTSKGEPTAGTYGFARELLRIIEQEKPDYIAVAFDTGKTFRNEIFPAYKGTRAKMPDDLTSQIKRIRETSRVSQAVFARMLNTSVSTVQKWEIGQKRPTGTALKLLHLVQKRGLDVIA